MRGGGVPGKPSQSPLQSGPSVLHPPNRQMVALARDNEWRVNSSGQEVAIPVGSCGRRSVNKWKLCEVEKAPQLWNTADNRGA